MVNADGGWFQSRTFLGMHSETFHLRNHPSRHRKERDDAALLTQEGNSPAFTVTDILCGKSIMDSSAWPGGVIATCYLAWR